MSIQHRGRLWLATLGVAWLFDFLFWEKPAGISFPIFTSLLLAAGFYLAHQENVKPAWKSLWLLLPVAVFALATALRLEPFTRFTNHVLTLLLLAVFAHTFGAGRWLAYSLSDYVAALVRLGLAALAYPIQLLTKQEGIDEPGTEPQARSGWQRYLPVMRGLLIALPVVLFFTALLASADPIFGDYLEEFVAVFRLENLPEYIFRGFYILVLGYFLAGIYLYALLKSQDEKLIGLEKPWLPPFLGFTETTITLGSVDALFAAFVVVQFRYFFGGQANIQINGYTYAEYARRGFGELLAVAFFSLLLFLGLSAISKRNQPGQQPIFSSLGIALVLLVGVMLVSAYQRLLLYEQAYGFSRLRTYAHIFMLWLGLLLVAILVLEIMKRQRSFALAALVAAAGFVVTLTSVNVDGLIVRQNVQRAYQGQELDPYYLNSLSVDSIPALVNAHQDKRLSQTDLNEVAAILVCQKKLLSEFRQEQPWTGYHWSRVRALQLLNTYTPDLSAVRVYQTETGSWWVEVNGQERPCQYDPFEYY